MVTLALKEVEAGTWPTTVASHREPQRQRYSRPIFEKLAFNWSVQDSYVELMNFEMEVTNILEPKHIN